MDLLQIRPAVNVKNNVALVVSVRVLSFTSEDENLTPTMSAIQSAECVEQRQSCIWGADNRMHNQEGRWTATANVHPHPSCSHKPGSLVYHIPGRAVA